MSRGPCHIEKKNKKKQQTNSSLSAARCEKNFILNGIGKLYFFFNIFLSIRASNPGRTVLLYSLSLVYGDVIHKCLSLKEKRLFGGQMGVPFKCNK